MLAVVPTATHQAPVTPGGTVVVVDVDVGGGGAVVVEVGPDVVAPDAEVDPDVVVEPAPVPVGVPAEGAVDGGAVDDTAAGVVVEVKGRPLSVPMPREQAMPLR